MTTTPRLGITQLEEGQALPEAVVNEADLILEIFATRPIVLSQGDNAPAGGESNGDAYLVGSSGTGAFLGHDDELAVYINGAWRFITPREGMEMRVLDEDASYVLTDGSWVEIAGAGSGPITSSGLTMATARLLGRTTASTGAVEEISVGSGLTLSSGTLSASGGAGSVWALLGAGQTATGVWDFAVDGAKANVDFTGLAGASDIRIIMHAVTKGTTGVPNLNVSVNNGSSWYTSSGDYVFMDTAGVVTNATTMCQGHLTNATAARSCVMEVQNANVFPPIGFNSTVGVSHRLFVASTSAINAIRISPSGGGNFTGGKIYCLAR